jgi:hypothetical protein
MIKFSEWVKLQESSPLTRKRAEVARGLQPPMADGNSHSTPSPWEAEQLEKQFKKSHKKKKKKND